MHSQSTTRPSRAFFYLALTTGFLTICLIVLGAVVRVTGSGLGCGEDWPLCNGRLLPPMDDINAWIEWSHRLTAMLIGVFGVIMLIVAWRRFFRNNAHRAVFGVTVAAALLYAAQSMLGAVTVKLGLSPTMVTLHLATAMLLLATLVIAGVLSLYRPATHYTRDNVTTLAYVTAGLAFLVILIGAIVRGSGASLACTDWPLCSGQILPSGQGPLAVVHMLHRFAVVGLGLSLLILVWQMLRYRSQMLVRWLAVGALVAYFLQATIGALFVFSAAAPGWAAAHVGVAALTWLLLIILCLIEMLNTHVSSIEQSENQWTPQSDAMSS